MTLNLQENYHSLFLSTDHLHCILLVDDPPPFLALSRNASTSELCFGGILNKKMTLPIKKAHTEARPCSTVVRNTQPRRLRHEDHRFKASLGLQSKDRDSLGNLVKPFLKLKATKGAQR